MRFEALIDILMQSDDIKSSIGSQNIDFNSEIENLISILKTHFGYSDRQLSKIRTGNNNSRTLQVIFWWFYRLSNILFLITILTFLVGIIIFILFYLAKI